MSVKVEVWGPYACFARPELKVERVSYDVMTPSAARGILDAIFWHPGLRWVVDRIYVLNPIRFTNIRRNEVKSKIPTEIVKTVMLGGEGKLYLNVKEEIQQRAALVLQDVRYVIEAHFDMTDKAAPGDNPGKFSDIMERRLKKGQCYHQPCFGNREFPANFRKWKGGDIQTAYPDEVKDVGFMLFDMDFSDPDRAIPIFFRAALKYGVIIVPQPGSAEVYK